MAHSPETLSSLARGTWTLDTGHSNVEFDIGMLGLMNVHGRFDRFDASLTVGDADDLRVHATIDVNSINTNQPARDGHLLAPDLLNGGDHPTLVFESTAVTNHGDHYALEGIATFRGVSKPLTLSAEFTGTAVHPADGKLRSGFVAHGEINRSDFGMDFNLPLGADKVALADTVMFTINALFFAPEAATA